MEMVRFAQCMQFLICPQKRFTDSILGICPVVQDAKGKPVQIRQ